MGWNRSRSSPQRTCGPCLSLDLGLTGKIGRGGRALQIEAPHFVDAFQEVGILRASAGPAPSHLGERRGLAPPRL
jgi:hypothetical protein